MEKRETSEKNFRVLALKYRPRRFSELVGQEALVKTLTNSFVLFPDPKKLNVGIVLYSSTVGIPSARYG